MPGYHWGVSMFQTEYDSQDFGYKFIEKSGDFILSSKKHRINFTLSGEFATIFQEQLKLIISKPDETLNKRIDRLIGIHLYYGISSALDEGGKNTPRFTK